MKKIHIHPSLLAFLSVALMMLYLHLTRPDKWFHDGLMNHSLKEIRLFLILRLLALIPLSAFYFYSCVKFARCVQSYSEKWASDPVWRAASIKRKQTSYLGKGAVPVYFFMIWFFLCFCGSGMYKPVLSYYSTPFSDISAVINITKDLNAEPQEVRCSSCWGGRALFPYTAESGQLYDQYLNGLKGDREYLESVSEEMTILQHRNNCMVIVYYPNSRIIKDVFIEDTASTALKTADGK
ncbi:MAG: hypothetical protein J5994_07550 [Ruminococcus sp.]|nr:hypothetical protein [Ruminococcus sp.]